MDGKITYNLPEDSARRKEASKITFEEEKEAAKIISDGIEELISMGLLLDEEVKVVQKFVDNYQNLSFHRTITTGLYATDSIKIREEIKNNPEMNHLFWEITF